MRFKDKRIESKAIRKSAEGEACTLQIVGICCADKSTTVLAHLPDESHGMARKSDDINSAYACASCHDAVDGRKHGEWERRFWIDFKVNKDFYMRRAQTRTLRKLIEKGIVTVK